MEGLVCERCGGSYGVSGGLGACPYCDHRRPAHEVALRGDAYEEAVARRRAAAELELVKAARYGQLQRLDPVWLIAAAATLGAVVLAAVPALMSSPLAMLFLVYVPLGGIFVRLLFWMRLPSATWTSPNALRVHCPLCGGPHEHAIDKALSRCQYCHASLAIDATQAGRGVSAADDAVRQAALQHFRASRQWGRGLARRSARMRRFGLAWTSFVPTAAMLYYARSPAERWEGVSAAQGWAAISAAVLGGVTFLAWRRRRVRAAARLQLSPMLDRYGGRWLGQAADVLEWLDVFWSGDYPVYDAIRADGGAAAACSVRGYPVLAILDPSGDKPFIDLLIAAPSSPPEAHQGASRAGKSQREWLVRTGFHVGSEPSGVCASLRGSPFREHFDADLGVGRALGELAALAAAEGRQPSRPG